VTAPGQGPDLPLNDPAFYASEPWATYRLLRDEHPAYWCGQAGFWAITRHEDALAVSKDPVTYCNGEGMTMRGGELADIGGGTTLITIDPPDHTAQRALVSRSFTPGAITRLEPRVRAIARDVLDGVPPGETVDFVDVVASRLPVIVIAELLGIPVEDRDKFVAWSNASVGRADPEYAHLQQSATIEQYQYFEEVLRQRRLRPADDLLSVIVRAEDECEGYTHADALALCFLLLAAGNETTRNLITHGVHALVRHPEQLSLLREKRDARRAVEELMRWVSPVIHMARTVTKETVVHGQRIAPGDQVVLLYGAANRDDRVFGATADDLDITRDPNPHLGFGFGTHFCLGAALARVEARVLYEELLDRFGHWTVVGPPETLHSTMIRGIKHLPVVLAV
jgi:cytochrome P450